jgi:hypothetical protein
MRAGRYTLTAVTRSLNALKGCVLSCNPATLLVARLANELSLPLLLVLVARLGHLALLTVGCRAKLGLGASFFSRLGRCARFFARLALFKALVGVPPFEADASPRS